MLLKTIEQLFNKPMFTDLIYPFSREDNAFLLVDGGLGMMWEVEGINIDGKGPEEMQKISTTFANFIKSLPEDTPMQLITFTSRGLDDEELNVYGNGDLSNSHIREYMARKATWHDKGKKEGFAHEGNIHFYPRTIKTYFTVKQRPLIPYGRLYDRENLKRTYKSLKRVEMVVNTALSSGGIKHRLMNEDDVIALIYGITNSKRSLDVKPPKYRGGDMRRSMVFNSPEAGPYGWTFEETPTFSGIHYNVITFENIPAQPDITEEADSGNLYTSPNILFREVNGVSLYDHAPTMLFAINFYLPSQDTINFMLNARRTMAFLHRFNVLGDESIDKEIARKESKKLLALMYSGEKIIKASYHLCIPSAPEEADFVSAQMVSHLNITSGCNAFREDLIAPGIFTRCLPFGFDQHIPDEGWLVRRAVTATASNIADVAPIYVSGRGVRTDKAAGWYNRRGASLWFDTFDRDTAITSPHLLITGATGAGKSVLACDFIQQVLRQPSTVFVIDMKDSFNKLCRLHGGQLLRFEGEPKFKMDPLIGDYGDDHRAFLTSVIAGMATGGSELITREEISSLSEAVLSLATSGEQTMQEIVNTLKSYADPVSKSLARKLFPWYGSGQYARFVEGDKPNIQLDNRLTVCEIGDLDTYKDLQAVIVFLLIFHITQYVKKNPGRKYLIIDEAWSLFKNEAAVDFLVKAVKMFRSYGCCVVFVTQQLDDFLVIARAMNMKDNCPNKILLYQEADVVTRAAKDLELNQGTLELYKTIRKGRRYTEALIAAQSWTAVGRNTLDPESYWVATSSPSDTDYLSDLEKGGMTLSEAIKHAAKEHPYGL